ncbi:MAG TPA: aminopeptidase N [Micromonosporaceae bacterium]
MPSLTRVEATARAALITVESYQVDLDLTGDGESFRSAVTIRFRATPGAETFAEVKPRKLLGVRLNDRDLDPAVLDDNRLPLTGLAAENTLTVSAEMAYSNTGEGLHRFVDPADGETYLYAMSFLDDVQRIFAAFDQPDLKAPVTLSVTAPPEWIVAANGPVAARPAPGRWEFAPTAPLATYFVTLIAGPWHVRRDEHDGIPLGIYCRRSLAAHLDADAEEIFTVTRQCLDRFHQLFAERYPFGKYDQAFVPEFNAGAMENPGLVTLRDDYVFRSAVTDTQRELRATTIAHEMAHMWFGDLVTMRWWDDLWLNESFAEWASHWCNVHATRFTDAWTRFLTVRKNWGYRQDQLSSTHPVYCDIPDVDAVEVNFDGITYAKGASVIKQLVAYVGIDAFVAGLRSYFAKHAWSNATFSDLLGALEEGSGKDLRGFAAQWLETAQVNTLRPEVVVGPDGSYESVAVLQEAPADHPTLRTHRLGIGLYDRDGDRLVRRQFIELTVDGARTEVPELAGVRVPDVLLLNDEDLTYAKLRLDERSMATVVRHVSDLDNPLARALCWAAAWDMVRDAELPARDLVAMVCDGLPAERDVNLVTGVLAQARSALTFYATPQWAPTGWARLAATAQAAVALAEPGSGHQLAWARSFVAAARSADELAVLRGWLDGTAVPDGLEVGIDLRWRILQALVAGGASDEAAIEAELDRDRTAGGERQAAMARALVPTPEAKAEVWRRLTGTEPLPNWLQRAMLGGFYHPAQVELTAPYATRYFEVLDRIWATRDSEVAQEFVEAAYPAYHVTEETASASDAWLAEAGHPAPLRRLVAEGRDAVVRALRGRACDAAAAG